MATVSSKPESSPRVTMSQRWRKQKGLFQLPHSTSTIPGWFWAKRTSETPRAGQGHFSHHQVPPNPIQPGLEPIWCFPCAFPLHYPHEIGAKRGFCGTGQDQTAFEAPGTHVLSPVLCGQNAQTRHNPIPPAGECRSRKISWKKTPRQSTEVSAQHRRH